MPFVFHIPHVFANHIPGKMNPSEFVTRQFELAGIGKPSKVMFLNHRGGTTKARHSKMCVVTMDDDAWLEPTEWLRQASDPQRVCKLHLSYNELSYFGFEGQGNFWILNESNESRAAHQVLASRDDGGSTFVYDASVFTGMSRSPAMTQAQDELDSGLFKDEYWIGPLEQDALLEFSYPFSDSDDEDWHVKDDEFDSSEEWSDPRRVTHSEADDCEGAGRYQ